MNANECSDALGEIQGHYIEEAITYRRRGRWIPWSAIAACLILVANLIIPLPINEIVTPTGGSQDYWAGGVTLSMPQIGDRDLIVEDVQISMDVQSLSLQGSDGIGSAVMEITLKNPTQEVVTVPIALPLGNAPRYLYTYDQNGNNLLTYPAQSLYRFTLNNTAISATHLITATDAAPDKERIQATDIIRMDSPVSKYTYRITELEESENPRITLWGFSRYSDYIVLAQTGDLYKPLHSDQEISIPIPEGDLPEVGETITVYIIGAHPEFKPGWYFKDWDTKERLDSTVVLESAETMPFQEFTNQTWNETLGIPRENWAFSVAAELHHFPVRDFQTVTMSSISSWAYHWLTYELTLEPGQTATHRIELPLYPDYFGGGSRTYHMNLSSLLALSPTGSQTLTLNTPFPMDQTSVQWEQNGTTYRLDLKAVRDMDMDFRLSVPASAEPVDPDMGVIPSRDWITWICIAVLIILFFLARKYRREDRK